jgi:hypothetical protein
MYSASLSLTSVWHNHRLWPMNYLLLSFFLLAWRHVSWRNLHKHPSLLLPRFHPLHPCSLRPPASLLLMGVETPLHHAHLVVVVLVLQEPVAHALCVRVGRRRWRKVVKIYLGPAVCVRKRTSASEFSPFSI